MAHRPAVDIAIHFKCGNCAHEWDHERYSAFGLFAYTEGGCETCASPAWGVQCPNCHGEMLS